MGTEPQPTTEPIEPQAEATTPPDKATAFRLNLEKHHDAIVERRKLKLAIRREKVKDLFARRRTMNEIAEILHVSRFTVYSDVEVIKQELAGTLTSQTAMDVATNTMMFGEVLERDIFRLMGFKRRTNPQTGQAEVYDPLEPMERIACANTLLKIRDTTIKQLQRLDVVYKAPERAEVRHVAIQKMAELPIDVLNQIADMHDDALLLKTLTKHLGADLAAQLIGSTRPDTVVRIANSDDPSADVEDAEFVDMDDDDREDAVA